MLSFFLYHTPILSKLNYDLHQHIYSGSYLCILSVMHITNQNNGQSQTQSRPPKNLTDNILLFNMKS